MPSILIATDNTEDAKVVSKQLAEEYKNIFISLNPDNSINDFELHRPDVLVLAFNSLEKAERFCLGLYRLSAMAHTHPHRTIILCNKDEVNRVYGLCKKDIFDDYILFWPMTFDAPRLAMAMRHALRDLSSNKAAASVVEFAAQARRLAELESLLAWNVTQSSEHLESASRSIGRVEQDMKVSLDGFSKRITQGDFAHLVEVKDANGLQHEIGKFQQEVIHDRFHAVTESIKILKTGVQEFQQKCAPHLESVRALKGMAEKVPITILVVDDDASARKLLMTILEHESYELMFAESGIEALNQLRKRRPDLILMDMMMPGIDGAETSRRIKSAERFANIPIIMVTCNSGKSVVTSCFKAGATDFVVKPFNREILLGKIRKFLLAQE